MKTLFLKALLSALWTCIPYFGTAYAQQEVQSVPAANQFAVSVHMEIDEQEMDRELIFDAELKTWNYEFNGVRSELTAVDEGAVVAMHLRLFCQNEQGEFVELSNSVIKVEWEKVAALALRHCKNVGASLPCRAISFGFLPKKGAPAELPANATA